MPVSVATNALFATGPSASRLVTFGPGLQPPDTLVKRTIRPNPTGPDPDRLHRSAPPDGAEPATGRSDRPKPPQINPLRWARTEACKATVVRMIRLHLRQPLKRTVRLRLRQRRGPRA